MAERPSDRNWDGGGEEEPQRRKKKGGGRNEKKEEEEWQRLGWEEEGEEDERDRGGLEREVSRATGSSTQLLWEALVLIKSGSSWYLSCGPTVFRSFPREEFWEYTLSYGGWSKQLLIEEKSDRVSWELHWEILRNGGAEKKPELEPKLNDKVGAGGDDSTRGAWGGGRKKRTKRSAPWTSKT